MAAEPDPLRLALLARLVLSLLLRSCRLPQPKHEGSSRASPKTDGSHVDAAAWRARSAAGWGGGVFAKHLSQQRPRFCCAWQGKINNRKKSLDPISRHGSLWAAWKLSFLVLSKQAMGWVHPLCFSRFFLGAPCDCCCHQWSSCGLPRGSEGK